MYIILTAYFQRDSGVLLPGIDFTKLKVGRKLFWINFHPQILDNFSSKSNRYKLSDYVDKSPTRILMCLNAVNVQIAKFYVQLLNS
jgi:hypothetical protein